MSPVADGMDADGLDAYAFDPYPEDLPSQTDFLDDPCDCAYQLPCAEHPEDDPENFPLSEDLDDGGLLLTYPGFEQDPNPLDADIDEVSRELIGGGDGHGSADARQLVCIQPLADRSALSHKERIVILEADVRDAMAYARARLDAEAMKYSTQGFTWNLDDVHFEHGGRRIVTATLRIARNGA